MPARAVRAQPAQATYKDAGETMGLSARVALAAIGAIAVLQAPVAAKADRYPFKFTWGGGEKLYLVCSGPLFRTSGCVPIGPGSYGHHEFYAAEDGFGGPTGKWGCNIVKGDALCLSGRQAPVDFCLGEPGKPTEVELEYAGGALTVNQPAKCGSARATSILSQTGEDDASPAQDVDTYRFKGKPGQNVKIELSREGSGGSAGAVATLRVRAVNGATLGARTGAVPLSLNVTTPGAIEIDVSRRPGDGDALRGYYKLEITPPSGDIGDRTLTPGLNVEQ